MANQNDVRRIALSLPGVSESRKHFAFSVRKGDKEKDFVWVWKERIDPKKPRVANPAVLAVRVADLDEKEGLLASSKKKFFTEPHYAGFPAVLVRLQAITAAELKPLIAAARRCLAPVDQSEAAFARLAAVLSKDPRVDPPEVARAKGFGSKGLKVERKLFAFQSKGRLVVKLPAARVDALVAAGTGARFDPGHGRVMKEWLAVDFAQQKRWMSIAREALDFAAA